MNDKTLETPLSDASFPTPDIEVATVAGLQDGWLRWSPEKSQVRTAREIQNLLYAFIRLGNAADGEIESFARKWGPLGLCQKDRSPICHGARYGQPKFDPKLEMVSELCWFPICPPKKVESERKVWAESVDAWREY